MASRHEEYCVKELVIMVFKPDSEHERKGPPGHERTDEKLRIL